MDGPPLPRHHETRDEGRNNLEAPDELGPLIGGEGAEPLAATADEEGAIGGDHLAEALGGQLVQVLKLLGGHRYSSQCSQVGQAQNAASLAIF
jgi:hypothetical protein